MYIFQQYDTDVSGLPAVLLKPGIMMIKLYDLVGSTLTLSMLYLKLQYSPDLLI